jgi:hypothetical protein
MPQQETYFEQQVGDKRIVVLKSYDAAFAREAFDHMSPEALSFLENSLDLDGAPSSASGEYADALWEGVQDGAREDWNRFSYFIVSEEVGSRSAALYVSSDWPSAEAYAKRYAGGSH